MKIPSLILKQLYTFGSLENVNGGVQCAVKNRLSDATLTGLKSIRFDGYDVPLSDVLIVLNDGTSLTPADISEAAPLHFPLKQILTIRTKAAPLTVGIPD